MKFVAPPHGARGLKLLLAQQSADIVRVAPPHGARGLKSFDEVIKMLGKRSRPRTGRVD